MSAHHKFKRRYRTDWFRVLVELQYRGYDHHRVARILDAPFNTVKGWKNGSEPAHNYGHALLEIWIEVTGKDLSARPMTTD